MVKLVTSTPRPAARRRGSRQAPRVLTRLQATLPTLLTPLQWGAVQTQMGRAVESYAGAIGTAAERVQMLGDTLFQHEAYAAAALTYRSAAVLYGRAEMPEWQVEAITHGAYVCHVGQIVDPTPELASQVAPIRRAAQRAIRRTFPGVSRRMRPEVAARYASFAMNRLPVLGDDTLKHVFTRVRTTPARWALAGVNSAVGAIWDRRVQHLVERRIALARENMERKDYAGAWQVLFPLERIAHCNDSPDLALAVDGVEIQARLCDAERALEARPPRVIHAENVLAGLDHLAASIEDRLNLTRYQRLRAMTEQFRGSPEAHVWAANDRWRDGAQQLAIALEVQAAGRPAASYFRKARVAMQEVVRHSQEAEDVIGMGVAIAVSEYIMTHLTEHDRRMQRESLTIATYRAAIQPYRGSDPLPQVYVRFQQLAGTLDPRVHAALDTHFRSLLEPE